ncbi:ABC transporter substrate-binding protein [uncultured Methanobacterium sp.]|uniref:ABC transporter substrate-binding protein n=1 Tax=uncultured Methanobacterium sp. TaxID=176306 RepID=UPI002AA6CB0C|nr:ABC transporter substrate-binding protein [uncultured Methanobacterium sp.]
MTIFIGIDDTGNSESVGTGKFARQIAGKLQGKYPIYGVTRHQFYKHPDIPASLHNFGVVIHLDVDEKSQASDVFESVKTIMLDNFNEGSNPGLAVAHQDQVTQALVAFGQDAKCRILSKKTALNLAKNSNIPVEGMGTNGTGMIGAMAGIGLASTHDDGRFLQIGHIRKLKGQQPVWKFMEEGVDRILTLDGRIITEGIISGVENKPVKPSSINGEVVLFVTGEKGVYQAINRD